MRAYAPAILSLLGLLAGCAELDMPFNPTREAPRPVAAAARAEARPGLTQRRQYYDQRRQRYYFYDRGQRAYFWEDGTPKT